MQDGMGGSGWEETTYSIIPEVTDMGYLEVPECSLSSLVVVAAVSPEFGPTALCERAAAVVNGTWGGKREDR